MATARDYRFALDGWQPANTEVISSSWHHARENGLPYIRFEAVVAVQGRIVIVECQCDPCDELAKEAYAEMVHTDLEKAIEKVLRLIESA